MNTECSRELATLLSAEIEQGQLPGAAIAIFQNGKEEYCGCFGCRDTKADLPVERDTIFRIYSMTKPITAVAAKILEERGLLKKEDLVSKFLPEYAMCTVLQSGKIVKMDREITIGDLLTMTSGLVYPDTDEAGSFMQGIFDEIESGIREGKGYSTREVVRKIASVPLAFQPGSRWRYGLSTDVLGGIIEVITQKSLREFLKEEILEPLQMKDTDFYVPKEKIGKLAQLYKRSENGLVIDEDRHLGLSFGLTPPSFESAGAGLYSTLNDYSKFTQMLAGQGAFGEVRILKEESVEEFRHNQLTPQQLKTVDFEQLDGFGYGHFMRTRMDDARIPGLGMTGEFGWDGWTGPYFTVDTLHDFTFIFMIQISEYSNWDLIWKLHNIIYKYYPAL